MQDRGRRLEGKVAVVTGAGPSGPPPKMGTGQAISIVMARQGARVVLVDRIVQRAEETLAVIRAEGGEASAYGGDVTATADCQGMAQAAVERYGALHILVNNVGILLKSGSVVETSEEDWDQVLSVNLKGMMLTCKYVIPRMMESGGGSVVNISSDGALRAGRGSQVHYNTAKGGVIALTTTMAAQHGRDGVRVNCVVPGSIDTPLLARHQSDEGRLRTLDLTPLGIEGTAWDVAWATLFLASEEARWITGVALPVDGGGLATPHTGV